MKLYTLIALIIFSNTSYATDSTSPPPLPKIENSKIESLNSELKSQSSSQITKEPSDSKKEDDLKNQSPRDNEEPFIDLNKVGIPKIKDTDSQDNKKQDENPKTIDEKKTEPTSPSNSLQKDANNTQLKPQNLEKEPSVKEPVKIIESIDKKPIKGGSTQQVDPNVELDKKKLPEIPSLSPQRSDVDKKLLPKKDLPIVTKSLLKKQNTETDVSLETSNNQEMMVDLDKFIVDETKMLLLPNDDIILGKLSTEAELDQIDFDTYIELYKRYNKPSKGDKQIAIENFIDNYDANFNTVPVIPVQQAENDAFEAARKNNLFKLRVLLDNYQLLQAKEQGNYTLLHQTAELDHYHLTKLLIMRGANLFTLNKDYKTPLTIALENLSDKAASILIKAGAK